MILSMYATNLTYAGASAMMGANEARMNLANSMTGGESPAAVRFAGISDKAYALEAANARMMYEVGLAMQGQAQAMRRKDMEQRQRMAQNGVIFF